MKKIITAFLFASCLYAESDYNLIFDPHLSPYIGADNLIMSHEMVEKSKLGQLSQTYSSQSSAWAKLGRGAELFLFWDPVNYLSMVAQHEVFGHGYRVRTLSNRGASVINYRFGTPFPYGNGGGATHYQLSPEKTTVFELLTISSGGMEATAIFANRIRLHWLRVGELNPKQGSLYLFSQQDITNYVTRSQPHQGDDIADYIYVLNHTYAGGNLTLKTLQKSALINFLDPFTYYSCYGWYKYIVRGKSLEMPMIPMGSYKFLPSARLGLTPFGPEYYLESLFVKGEKPFYLYLRGSNFAGMASAGIGIECPYATNIGSLPVGFRLDFWQQPKLQSRNRHFAFAGLENGKYLDLRIKDLQVGMAASIVLQKKLWSTGALFVQCGAKTKGFVPGESLEASPIIRLGITLW